jgi:D-glycero-alpha-D-manno-heptose-7-phosphate kinase
MIITATPIRVSFLGGGTDYPEYFEKHGGATLGASIDKYTYLTVSPLTEFFDHTIRISYSKTELCRSVDDIQHPSVRECLKFMQIDRGIEINVVSDLPARTGLGSSSSFTVGLLHALHVFKGQMASQEQLAEEAVHVEREMIKERVGLQDQYTCSRGGLLNLQFNGTRRVVIRPLVVKQQRLQALKERLLLFYTGLQRYAHNVLEEQMARTVTGDIDKHLKKLHKLVDNGIEVLVNGKDLSGFGDLLHQAWSSKKQLSSTITNPMIDETYERARKAGAIGGKLLGAGSGGFLLLYVEPYNQQSVRNVLNGMREVDFQLESHGTRLIYFQHN